MKALPPRFLKLKLAAFLIGAISLTGCGDDGLGSSYQASDRPDEEEELGPKSPLEPGTEYWFAVNWSFKRTTQTDDSGATQGEAQSVGHVCLEIDSLKDTATYEYKDRNETLVTARVKATGAAGSANLDFSDQNNPSASGEAVDDLLSQLWLKSLTVPSVNHGYDSPTTKDFRTQGTPHPPQLDLSNLPFFEVRELAAKDWAGWVNTGGELTGAKSFTTQMLSYFQDTYGSDITTDRTRFRFKFIVPPASCAEFSDPGTCNQNNCTWGRPSEGGSSACFRLYSMVFTWRDTIDTPPSAAPEQGGDVLRLLELNYYEDGSLNSAREELSPGDLVPMGENLPAELPQCLSNCLTSSVEHYGAFLSNPAYPAPCAF